MTETGRTESVSEELLPCPFCGGTEQRICHEETRWPVKHYHWVQCWCEGAASGPKAQTKADAIAAWNRRASSPALAPEEVPCPRRVATKCETPLACKDGCRYADDPIHPNRTALHTSTGGGRTED